MKYLFFDCESIHIEHKYPYTFGYVLIDENFKILKGPEDIVFNPDIKKEDYDWRVIRKMMYYKLEDVCKLKDFSKFYNKIQKIMQGNVVCIGFEVEEDVRYILNICLKYNLKPINFKYLDLRDVIKKVTNKTSRGLAFEYSKWCNKMPHNAHKSDEDSEMTMEILHSICKKTNRGLPNLIAHIDSIGECKNYCFGYNNNLINISEYYANKLVEKQSKTLKSLDVKSTRKKGYYRELKEGQTDWILKGSLNQVMFIRFLDFVKPTKKAKQVFKDKKISISLNYEMYNFQNMLKLVQLITNAGGTYVKKGTIADIFVKQWGEVLDDKGNPRGCSKHNYILNEIENGKEIEVLEFDEFLTKLGLDIDKLNSLPNIDIEYLKDEKYSKKNET